MEHFATFCDHPHSCVSLRVPEKFDADLVLPWMNDTEIRRYTNRFAPIMREAEEAYFTRMAAGSEKTHAITDATFIIVNKEPRKSIGVIGLHQIDWRNHRATTGTVIGEPSFRSKGLGADAKMLLLNWAFNELGLLKIESRVVAFNDRSQAYSRKCGYEEVGLLKRHHFRNGQWADEVIMEVHARKWRRLWKKFEEGNFRKKTEEVSNFPGHCLTWGLTGD